VGRAVCVLAVGMLLFVAPILLTSESNQRLAGRFAMIGWVIGVLAIIDLGISVFTIVANKSKGQ